MNSLSYELNPYGGAVIDSGSLPGQPDEFSLSLQETINSFIPGVVKVVWLSLPLEKAALVPAAVAAGFVYHHADSGNLQLTKILVPGSFIPPYATHYIGAGGVVVDDQNRLLVVTERYHPKHKKHYKLPGGALDEGEHIAGAVRREVKEETGIETEFMYLACLRHWHGYRYGKSDIYFVCRLKPLTHEITIDPSEISEGLWMPLEDYLGSPDTHPFNRRIVRSALTGNGIYPEAIEGYGTAETHEMLF